MRRTLVVMFVAAMVGVPAMAAPGAKRAAPVKPAPVIAPAVANALLARDGKPVRALPLA